MKKGKLLEVLRIAVMYIILEKEGSMSANELGNLLDVKYIHAYLWRAAPMKYVAPLKVVLTITYFIILL